MPRMSIHVSMYRAAWWQRGWRLRLALVRRCARTGMLRKHRHRRQPRPHIHVANSRR